MLSIFASVLLVAIETSHLPIRTCHVLGKHINVCAAKVPHRLQ